MAELTKEQILRYSRHLIMPEVGIEGQRKLLDAKVLLIGAGGLGSPLGLYLAAAGVGTLGIVDFDAVDFTNLQRQIIHRNEDVGRLKVESAKERIQSINPQITVNTYNTRLSRENILGLAKDYDLIIDGTDNFPTRYLVNDACVFLKKPNVYGSIFRFEGQATVFFPFKGPCYRCLFPEPPPPGMVPSCAEGGVLGVLPGIIGTIQATEGIKLIIGKGEPLIGRLLLFNALAMEFRVVKLKRNPDCPVCGDHPTITKLIDYEQFCGVGRGEEGATEATAFDVSPQEAKALLEKDPNAVLLDVREPHEHEIVRIEGAKLIPLGELHLRTNELDTANMIVVHCHHGPRSQQAVQVLQHFGFKKLKHLRGGIDAWASEVDQEMARY
ncbi:MAG: molybdopterin-synthase adenylyltransferase MoeB [Candidatus Omnitrophica bacterium]|nr:molybdopterin-synthase adenylyltransferase MoeB [Candidatus Omnitrophota bacterium]